MDEIVIHGGRRLSGVVSVSGSKNAALAIMAATLLTEGPTILHRVPRLSDVETMAGILRSLGVSVEWIGPQTLKLVPQPSKEAVARFDLVVQMRGSICVLGPLLAVRGSAVLPMPGGCVLGKRPINLHVIGLRALGARIRVRKSCIYAHAGHLEGARVSLRGPHGSTVLGTANVMMAATLARGRTVIEDAACEPETQDLAGYLKGCGAHISGIGSHTLVVEGTERLHGAEYTVIPDRIEAGTFAASVAATSGEVTLEGGRPDHMWGTIELLERMGVEVSEEDDRLFVARSGALKAVSFGTAPYPGIATDMHPQFAALLCIAEGKATISEGIYPERFAYAAELSRMGARIIPGAKGVAIVESVPALHGTAVHASDLRAGAALVVAALAAQGTTVITGVDQVDRGYQRLEERLSALGADIHRRQAETLSYEQRKSA